LAAVAVEVLVVPVTTVVVVVLVATGQRLSVKTRAVVSVPNVH